MAFTFPTTGLVANVTTATNGETTWIWTGSTWDLKPVTDPVISNLTVLGGIVAEGRQSFIRNTVDTVNDLSNINNSSWKGLNVFVNATGALYYADGTEWNRIAKYSETGFRNIAVSGSQTLISGTSSTLNIVGSGSNRITTDFDTNTITITGEATGIVGSGQAGRLAYYAETGSTVSDIGSKVEWDGSTLTIGGGISVETLEVTDAVSLTGLSVNNSITAGGDLTVTGTATIATSLTVAGNASVVGDLNVTGSVAVNTPTIAGHAANKSYVDNTATTLAAQANARSIAMSIALG